MKTLKSIIAIIILYIISFNICAQSNVTAYNHDLPNKLTFQIELTLDQSQELPKKILDIFQTSSLKHQNNQNIYLLGAFPNNERAEFYRNSLSKFGYDETNVVAYFRKRRISMQDAITLATNYNRYDESLYADNISDEKYNEMATTENVRYNIEFDRYTSVNTLSKLMHAGFEITTSENGNYKLNQELSNYSEIENIKAMLSESQIMGAIVTAYIDDQQVSVAQAKSVEENFNSYTAYSIEK